MGFGDYTRVKLGIYCMKMELCGWGFKFGLQPDVVLQAIEKFGGEEEAFLGQRLRSGSWWPGW